MYDSQCIFCYSELLPNGKCPVCLERQNRSKRGRAYKRHQRRRIIQKRQNIYFHIWNNKEWYDTWRDGWVQSPYSEHPGRLAKYNLSCNCWMCKYEKLNGIEKLKYKAFKDEYED